MTRERVSGIVISHGHADAVAGLVPLLLPQLDELLLIENRPGSVPAVEGEVRVIRNVEPRTFAANINAGVASTSGEYVLVSNPDVVPARDAVEKLRAFMATRPRAGIAGPEMRWPDGSWQPTRRRFPTVGGTLVRRTPLRLLFGPYTQRRHNLLDERPTAPVEADWLLGAYLLMRRSMLESIGGWDAGYRHYGEDIDLAYRAAKAGWERWYVPGALVTHDYAAVVDRRFFTRHTLWHARGMLRFVRKHPERLRAL